MNAQIYEVLLNNVAGYTGGQRPNLKVHINSINLLEKLILQSFLWITLKVLFNVKLSKDPVQSCRSRLQFDGQVVALAT